MVSTIFTLAIRQQAIPKVDPAELKASTAKGWHLKETTDEGTGIFRRFYVSQGPKGDTFQGIYRSWYKTGIPRAVSNYKDGLREGHTIWWFESGKKWKEGTYRRDQQDGNWTFWDKNETKIQVSRFHNNLPDGPASFWTPDGKLAAKGGYKMGLPEGPWIVGQQSYLFRDGVVGGDQPKTPPGPPKMEFPEGVTKLDVRVDPRMELLAIVQNFTTWEQSGAFSTVDEQYKRDVAEWFGPFKNHPTVKLYQKILDGGTNFAFDGPVNWMLHQGDLPDLTPISPPPTTTIQRGGGEKQLEELRLALREFTADTHFLDFFAKHRPFYDELIQEYRSHSPGDKALELVMEHYGEIKQSGTVVICPLFGGGNYGIVVETPKGPHIFNVGAPTYENGKFRYHTDDLQSLIYHEFGHSFSNPAVDASDAFGTRGDELFPLVKNLMAPQAYGSWSTVVYELFVRTNEVRLVELGGNGKLSRSLLGSYTYQRGFCWLPYTLKKLRAYEGNRTKYPTFRSFAGEMAKVFDETKPISINGTVVCVVPR